MRWSASTAWALPSPRKEAGIIATLAEHIKAAAATDPIGTYRKAGLKTGFGRKGDKVIAQCPFHADEHPSFKVTMTGEHAGKWYCHGACKEGGSILDFVMKLQGIEFTEAVQRLANLLSISESPPPKKRPDVSPEPVEKEPKAVPRELPAKLHSVLIAEKNKSHLDVFMALRGLDEATIALAQIGHDGERFTIPVIHQGRLLDIRRYKLGAKGDDQKFLAWGKGYGGTHVYGWDWVKDDSELVLCEGELDALRLLQEGIPAFTITNGAGKWPDDPPDLTGKIIYLCGDNDDAGRKMNADLPLDLYAAGAQEVRIIALPSAVNGFDVTDYFLEGGTAKGFMKLMGAAKLVTKPKPSRDLETAQDLLDNPEPPARWQIEGMIERGSLVTMAGKSKSRKSFMSLQLTQAVATGGYFLGRKCEQGKALYVPLEDGRRRVQSRLVTQQQNSENKLNDQTRQNIIFRYAEQWVPLNNPEGSRTIRALIEQNELDLVIIDPFAAAKTGKLDENMAGEVADILNELRGIAQATDCTIILVHHHHKLATGDAILDMRGTSAIGAAADVILGVYVDKRKHESRIVVEGRDADDIELVIEFDRDDLLWRPLGDANKVAASQAEREALAALKKIGKAATAESIAELVGVSVQAVRAPLELLVDKWLLWRHEVRSGGRGRPAIFYGLADWQQPQDMTLTEEK